MATRKTDCIWRNGLESSGMMFSPGATGMSNTEIADHLVVSPATAKTHVSHILTKLNLRDRAQLVMVAYETGLVTPGA